MRTSAILLFLLGLFFLIVDGVYWLWNYLDHGGIEWTGSLAILLTVGLVWFPSYFMFKASKNQDLPEDRQDATIDEGDAEIGFFSPWSWWPILLAAGAATTFLGVVLGWWLFAIGAAFAIVALVGWSFEHHRGSFGH